LADEVWVAGRSAHIERDALIRVQAAAFQKGMVRVGEEMKQRLPARQGILTEKITDALNDCWFSHAASPL
jgi:hypothetical protein